MTQVAKSPVANGSATGEADTSSEMETLSSPRNQRAKLSVITGAQQGAVAWLVAEVPFKLGSSLDDDIVLRDASVGPSQAVLILEHGVVSLSCMAGKAMADGLPVVAGEQVILAGNALIQLGDVAMMLDGAPGHADIVNPIPSFFLPPVDDFPVPAAQQQDEGNTVGAERIASHRKATVLASVILALAALVLWQSDLFRQQVSEPLVLKSALAVTPFAALSVTQNGDHAIIQGFLETVRESVQLDQWLDQTGLTITNEVIVGESLADQVFDVFRVHGVSAEVKVTDGAHAVAITHESSEELLAAVEDRIRADVPGVATLTIDNSPPPASEPASPVKPDPGKRVAMVVSDEPAHIVTEDKSRYFVGSVLPTGHRIAVIEDGTVFLDKDGTRTTLEF